MKKELRRLFCIVLAALMCLSLLPAALASGEMDEAEAETAVEETAAQTEADEAEADETPAGGTEADGMTPAEDGTAYYEREVLGQTEKEKVQVQSWVRADRRTLSLMEGQSDVLRVVPDAGKQNLTYAWSRIVGYGGQREELEGVAGPSCPVEYIPDCGRASYICLVECDDDEEEIWFDVYFYRNYSPKLFAYPEGTDKNTSMASVSAGFGGDVTLRVCVEDADGNSVAERVSGAWYEVVTDENGRVSSQRLNETGPALRLEKVDKACSYRYEAYDEESGGSDFVRFTVEVENDLTVRLRHSLVVDYEYDRNGIHFVGVSVPAGQPAELTAIASARNTSGLTGVWKSDGAGADAEPVPVTSADLSWKYILMNPVMKNLNFEAKDTYGNVRNVSVLLRVENHFRGDKVKAIGGVTQLEYTPVNGYTITKVSVDPGEPLTLESLASADDPTGITYKWRDRRSGSGYAGAGSDEDIVTTKSFSLESVDKPGEIMLQVADAYGNDWTVSVEISLENGFTVSPAGARPGRHEVEMPMGRGGKATLKVNASANDASKLSYEWGCITAGGEWVYFQDEAYTIQPLPGEVGVIGNQPVSALAKKTLKNSDELIVENIPETITYFCRVSDGYGNEQFAYFHLNIRNARYGTAGRMDPLDANGDGLENTADAPIFLSRQELFEALLLVRKLVGLKAN